LNEKPPVKIPLFLKICRCCTKQVWAPKLRKWFGKKKSSGQGKVRKFYFESGKTEILKKSQRKLKYNTGELIPFRIPILEETFEVSVMTKKANLLKTCKS